MEDGLHRKLRELINVIDELRDIGLHKYINLPRICVVGTQSSGKSSVLEMVMGIDCLPRGEGIVTRRPLELRLVHLSPDDGQDGYWAVFENDASKKWTDFELVRNEINELTDKEAGRNKGIIDKPIVLTIYGRKCPDLTLIDLPGITRVPLKGSDQTDDIERLTRDMAVRYASDPRTIILAVVPANQDISTSDALQLARRVDPKGSRTIGVLTKIDLMDRGLDATRMLTGEEIPLKLGYTAVVNRSSADIKASKTIQHSLMDEEAFFANHPIYRNMPGHYFGTRSLIDKLSNVLFRHIKHVLPMIQRDVLSRCRTIESRLMELGNGVPENQAERSQLLWTMITEFTDMYRNVIRGKFDKRVLASWREEEMLGGSQIRQIFNDLLVEYVNNKITSSIEDHEIDSAIRLHEGDSLPGFPSPDTFECLIVPHLRQIQAPVMYCLERISQYLCRLAQHIADKVFGRFPKLTEKALEIFQENLNAEKEVTKHFLTQIVTSETGYLFTNDVSYLAEHGSMIYAGAPQTTQEQPPHTTTKESQVKQMLKDVQNTVAQFTFNKEKKRVHYNIHFINEIRKRLDAYFSLVLRNVRDSVPKAIGCFLVRKLEIKLQFELYNHLNAPPNLNTCLGESPHIEEERKELKEQLIVLQHAYQVLQRDKTLASVVDLSSDDETSKNESNKVHTYKCNEMSDSSVSKTRSTDTINVTHDINPPPKEPTSLGNNQDTLKSSRIQFSSNATIKAHTISNPLFAD